MLKKFVTYSMLTALALTAFPVLAVQEMVNMKLETPGVEKDLVLPSAAGNSQVISLGSAVDPQTNQVVEGYAIIHYKKASARPGGSKGGPAACYGYLASGAKWKTIEPWVANAENTRGLDTSTVFATLNQGVQKWEDATDGIVGNSLGVNVIGEGSETSAILVADQSSPDGVNEVYFANVADSNAIAVTIVWGIFSGPTFQRQLVEWDQVYDDSDFDWSLTGELYKMDFDNIATHELGHTMGMGDLYTSGCSDQTMYGYASEGETNKRDLNSGDINGINNLY